MDYVVLQAKCCGTVLGKIKSVCIILSLFYLTGCAASDSEINLAPRPPEQGSYFSGANRADSPEIIPDTIQPSYGSLLPLRGTGAVIASYNNSPRDKGCKIKDRFDRKSALSYQWRQNTIAMHVSGLNLGFQGISNVDQVKIEYKLSLQNFVNKKRKCLYKSPWQGVFGSSYHEFFERESDTVLQYLREVRKDFTNKIDDM